MDAQTKKLAIICAGLLMLALIVAGFTHCSMGKDKAVQGDGDTAQKEEPITFRIVCAGDIMAHAPNLRSAYDSSTGTYDFNDNYKYMTDYLSWADLALCNMETTFAGTEPRGYPTFNSPDALAEAVKNAGFDVAITSNNHMMDSGFDGMQRTLEVLRGQGLVTVGSRYEGEASYAMTEVKGVKIGIVAYTYETTGADDSGVTINGNRVSEEAQKLINSFNYHELETTDYDKIQKDIDDAKAAGAELVLCYFHWGEEYQREPNDYELAMAQRAADMGADVIFASHPHLLQKADTLLSTDGRTVPVFYSMGNFISNQRSETLSSVANARYTEQGMLACVDFVYQKSTGKIESETLRVLPTWVDRYYSPWEYRIIPLDGNLANNEALKVSGHYDRAAQSLEDARQMFGDSWLNGITVKMGETAADVLNGKNTNSGESENDSDNGNTEQAAA